MFFLIDTQTIIWMSVGVAILIILVLIAVFLITPKELPIEIIKDHNGKLLFDVYVKGSAFYVVDHTNVIRKHDLTIDFKSYHDVELYISRRLNGWVVQNDL